MLDLLILSNAVVIIIAAWVSLGRTRDPLSPMIIFSPMLLYMFVYDPWSKISTGALQSLFSMDQLVFVQLVYLLTTLAFCIGLSWQKRNRQGIDRRFDMLEHGLTRATRAKLFMLAILMGLAASAAFWYMVQHSGGWSRVFSKSKPFLKTPSGYIGEMPMLVYPALLMLATAWQGRRMLPHHITMFLLVGSPQIIMATMGGRRGPMFLIACTLGVCWCIVRSKRPSTKQIIISLGALGLMLMMLGKYRSELFTPWKSNVDYTAIADDLTSETVTLGDEYVAGAATILAAHKHDRYYWGVRYFTTIFVRPIPKQIWPSKYQDFGLGWMETDAGLGGFTRAQWYAAVNFEPAKGNAGGFIADSFLEFSWGCVLLAFLIGRLYSSWWKKWTMKGGLWALLYFEVLILSVYLPSQSVGAWGYRLMLLGVPTWVIWKTVVEPGRSPRVARRPLSQHAMAPRR